MWECACCIGCVDGVREEAIGVWLGCYWDIGTHDKKL